MTFERVYTMTDYYDGPRAGIASFAGTPHAYACPFEHWLPGLGDLYELRPVDPTTFRLALEDWEIWLRWEAARAAGEIPLEPHGVLPEDRARADELDGVLASRLDALPPPFRARGVFRTRLHDDHLDRSDLEVEWTREP